VFFTLHINRKNSSDPPAGSREVHD